MQLSNVSLESGFGEVSSMAHGTFVVFLPQMQFVMENLKISSASFQTKLVVKKYLNLLDSAQS